MENAELKQFTIGAFGYVTVHRNNDVDAGMLWLWILDEKKSEREFGITISDTADIQNAPK